MLITHERQTPFDDESRRPCPDHHRRADMVATVAGAMLTLRILVGARPLTAAERAARRRYPPPRVSKPSISHSISAI